MSDPIKTWWALLINDIVFVELAGPQEYMLDRAKKYNATIFSEVFDAPDLHAAMKIGKEKIKEELDKRKVKKDEGVL